jgi:hypothetical protein
MADDKQVQDVNQEQVDETKQDSQLNVEELIAQKTAEIAEQYKKELAGLNKRNSELEKKIKLTEQEKMTEAERLEAERKELQAEKDAIKREKINLQIIKELASVGLPADFANRISGETEDEIKADVKALKEFLDKKAHELSEAEIAKRLKGDTPKGGQNPTGKTMTREAFQKLDPKGRIDFMSSGGKLTD